MIKTITFITSFFLFLSVNSCKKNEMKKKHEILKKEGKGISIQQCKNYSTQLYKNNNTIIGLTYIISDDNCKTVVDTVLDVYKDYHQIDNEKIKKKIFNENQASLIELKNLVPINWNRKVTDSIIYDYNNTKIIKTNKMFYLLKNNKKYFLFDNKIDYIGFNITDDNLLCFYLDMGNCCDIGKIDIYKIFF